MTDAKLRQAVEYYQRGNKQNAEILFDELVKSEPDNASAW